MVSKLSPQWCALEASPPFPCHQERLTAQYEDELTHAKEEWAEKVTIFCCTAQEALLNVSHVQ